MKFDEPCPRSGQDSTTETTRIGPENSVVNDAVHGEAEFSGQFWGVLQSPAFQLFSKQARPSFGTVSPLMRIAVNVYLLLTATLQPSHDWDYGNPGALLGNNPTGLRVSSAFNSASARSKCKNLEWNVSAPPRTTPRIGYPVVPTTGDQDTIICEIGGGLFYSVEFPKRLVRLSMSLTPFLQRANPQQKG
jgi:hypothetical protein